MAEVQIWNNPWLALEYNLHIDLETGKTFYKTNFIDGRKQDYECFFLVGEAAQKSMDNALLVLNGWQEYYGDPAQLCLDGYHWSIKVIDSSIRIFKGDNDKPAEFDDFIAKMENLIQRTLSSENGYFTY